MAVWSEISSTSLINANRFDGEYFAPLMLDLESTLLELGAEKLSKRKPKITYGTTPKGAEWVTTNEGVPFVRSQDFSGGIVEQIDQFCSKHHHAKNYKSAINGGDVLVAAIGATIGSVGLYPTRFEEANTNQNIARIRLDTIEDNIFLWSFLCSIYGNRQLHRLSTGNAQPYLNSIQIKKVLVPWLLQGSFDSELVKRFENSTQQANNLYIQAKQLLEAELGLDKLHFDKPVGYTARFSELELSRRTDSQHYQPRFAKLLEHLAKFPIKRIREIRRYNRRGIQPVYAEDGTFAVVNSQHLGPKHINYGGLQKTTEQAFNASPVAHIKPDDLLIYTTGAYIGRTNVYLGAVPAFASNHVNILRLSPEIDHAYMAMVFQSIVGQFQTQKHARGSAQAELYPMDIDKFVVPLLTTGKQAEIGTLVRESLTRQRQSAQLLDQAKSRVEKLIEEAVQK